MGNIDGYIDAPNDMGGLTPLRVETHTIIPPTHLAENIRVNIERPVPRFASRPGLGIARVPAEPLAIVAAGPTLNDTIDRVRGFKNILVCGSAHDHLVRAGIVPTYALVCDGGKEDKGNLSLPQAETTYIIASQCDPGLFEHLKDHKVEMWHYRGQASPDLDAERVLLKGEPSLSWGSSVTVVSIQLCMLLGFQDFHFFGFDSCYGRHGIDHHCTQVHGALDYQKMPATVAGRTFISDLALMEQCNQFFRIVEAQGEFFHCTFYGDGLIAWMAKNGEPGLETYITVVSDELEQAA
jgi:hypothetical protein